MVYKYFAVAELKITFVTGDMEEEILQTTEERFLLSAMQHGDLKAYGVLFRRYYPMLCAYAPFYDLG